MLKFHGKSFPLKLKLLRLESGKSQEILATELGISRSCLANYETGKRQPDRATLAKIATLFQVEDEFFFDKPFCKGAAFHERPENGTKPLPPTETKDETIDISDLSTVSQFCIQQFYNFLLNSDDEFFLP